MTPTAESINNGASRGRLGRLALASWADWFGVQVGRQVAFNILRFHEIV